MTGTGERHADLQVDMTVVRGPGITVDVQLDVASGSTAALLGPNGAGKSTTVDAIAGLLPIDRGIITLGDRILDEPAADRFVPPEDRRIGVVFQQDLLFEHLEGAGNVAFGPRAAGTAKREARAAADRWLDRLGLTDLAARRPSALSGGQARKVALARALATEPDLLVFDEPLAPLDVASRTEMRRFLANHLGDDRRPRLLITHDPADAALLADRIHVVEDGRITQHGTPDEIRRHPATPYVAALAGVNLLEGSNDGGLLTLDHHGLRLQAADAHTNGPVLITIHPNAIALHDEEPHGSPRNAWATTVTTVEPLGEITRIMLGDPLPVGVDVTPAATAALGLGPGRPVWASVKATEIALRPV